jgi:predicted HicB family RNase H-like nuclease
MMEYRGYTAGPIDFNAEENTFSGTVTGLKDVIHFEGKTAKELARASRESVDSYLKFCEETGQEPDRPYNGKICYARNQNCTARPRCAQRFRE